MVSGYNPAYEHYEGREAWLRSCVGTTIWLGICWPDNPRIHGHRHWLVHRLAPSPGHGMTVFLEDVEVIGGKTCRGSGSMSRVPLTAIMRGFMDEPPEEKQDFMRQWDQGLSPPPDVPDFCPL